MGSSISKMSICQRSDCYRCNCKHDHVLGDNEDNSQGVLETMELVDLVFVVVVSLCWLLIVIVFFWSKYNRAEEPDGGYEGIDGGFDWDQEEEPENLEDYDASEEFEESE